MLISNPMIEATKKYFEIAKTDSLKLEELNSYFLKKYEGNNDPWGLNIESALKSLKVLLPLYKQYFKVRLFIEEDLPDTNFIVCSNHSGQIAIDAALIGTAFAYDVNPPTILRGMVERFFISLPFLSSIAQEAGAVLGDRQNCINLLNRNESVLVFPEGVKGVSKSTSQYYQLQHFTRGFYRMAIETNKPIIPISVIGAEEFYPLVWQLKGLAKKLGLPALPFSPSMLLGPIGLLPLPSPVDIYIGKPIYPKKLALNDDYGIAAEVDQIKKVIQTTINKKRKSRREFWANIK